MIVKDYVKPLMQLLTNDLREYNMMLKTTKCLNTGIMLMFFFSGKLGIDVAEHCENNEVIRRQADNRKIMENFVNDALVKRTAKNKREIFYFLIAEGHLKSLDPQKPDPYFPGHVFVVEKVQCVGGAPRFHLYQSYINEYDLKQYYDKMFNNTAMSIDEMRHLFDSISYVLTNGIWDRRCTEIWREFTKVDASSLEGASSEGRFFFCYNSITTSKCRSNLSKYLNKKLFEFKNINPTNYDKVYGDETFYDKKEAPLTNGQMKEQIQQLLAKIETNSR